MNMVQISKGASTVRFYHDENIGMFVVSVGRFENEVFTPIMSHAWLNKDEAKTAFSDCMKSMLERG